MGISKKHQVFVDEMVKHGDHVKAYMMAYPKAKKESARVKSYNLLQNDTLKKMIAEQSDKIRSEAHKQAIVELKEEIKANILTRIQKQEILYKIATGEHLNEKKKPVFNPISKKFETIIVIEKSDDVAMMKAIEIENRMTGDNAPEKRELTGKDGKSLIPEPNFDHLTVEEIESLLLKHGNTAADNIGA